MRSEQISNSLKASLFELTYIIEDYDQKELMEMLCFRMKEIMDAEQVNFYMYNQWELGKQLTRYASSYPILCNEIQSLPQFIDFFNEKPNIYKLDDNEAEEVFLLKIHCENHFYRFIIINFATSKNVTTDMLDEVRVMSEKFLRILYSNRYHQFLQKREHLLYEISTKLHTLYSTDGVFEEVFRAFQTIYPSYRQYFIMSQEFHSSSFPIKVIEYRKDKAMTPDLKAFMNNALQIETDTEKEETNVYSPLSGEQGVYGVIQVQIPKIVHVGKEEATFLNKFSNIIGRALERTTLYQKSNQLVSDLQIINAASHELNVNLEQSEITETVKKYIFDSCHAEQIGVALFSKDGCKEKVEVLKGSTDYFNTVKGKKFMECMYERIQKYPQAYFTGDFQSKEIEVPFQSLMIIPMHNAEDIFGTIIIAHRMPYYFSFEKYKFIQSFVQHASIAFYNSILKERLEYIAITDYLTKLYSRNHLDHVIKDQMRKKVQGVFVLFDVDDFKQVNDTYGHYIGDSVLIQIAEIIKKELQEEGIAARWGGEEFALYLPDYNLEQASEKVNRIRKMVMEKTNPSVSLSCGVSIWTNECTDSIEELFIRTDEALYEAKLSGKNKTVQKTLCGTNSL